MAVGAIFNHGRVIRAMRRRHGIPDDDHRPFNVAYAAALQARKGQGGKSKNAIQQNPQGVSVEDGAQFPPTIDATTGEYCDCHTHSGLVLTGLVLCSSSRFRSLASPCSGSLRIPERPRSIRRLQYRGEQVRQSFPFSHHRPSHNVSQDTIRHLTRMTLDHQLHTTSHSPKYPTTRIYLLRLCAQPVPPAEDRV